MTADPQPDRVLTIAEAAEFMWQSWPPEVQEYLAEQAARVLRPRPVTTPTRRAS